MQVFSTSIPPTKQRRKMIWTAYQISDDLSSVRFRNCSLKHCNTNDDHDFAVDPSLSLSALSQIDVLPFNFEDCLKQNKYSFSRLDLFLKQSKKVLGNSETPTLFYSLDHFQRWEITTSFFINKITLFFQIMSKEVTWKCFWL